MDNSQSSSSSQQDYLQRQQRDQQQQQQQYDNNRKKPQSPQQHVNSTTQSVLSQLSSIYSQVLQKQKSLLNQLLNLEKLLNHTLPTQPLTQNQIKNEKNNSQKKIQQKKEFNLQRIGQKIQQIIDQTDEVIVAVQEEDVGNNNSQQYQQQGSSINAKSKNNSNNTIIGDKKNTNKKITIMPYSKKQPPKQLTYKLQPMPDKKPPIPTANRSVEGVNRVMNTVKYVPPRNKNQVTGKVTQTKILAQDKVFRPEITGKVGSSNVSGSKGSSALHGAKINSVDEKRQTSSSSSTTIHTQQSLPSSSTTTFPSLTKPPLPSSQDINSISQYKNIRATNNKSIKLKQFTKPTKQLYQQYMSKKQSIKKKYNFNKLLEKYQQQELGHKALQEKRRFNYIKKLNHLGLSMNLSTSNDITHSIAKRIWKGYPHIFEFNQLLERMQQDISRIEQQYKDDLRSDPKEVYRIQCVMRYIERQVGKIMASTEIEVPEKLQLTFQAVNNKEQTNNQQQQQQQHQQSSQSTSLTLSPLYQQLLSLLQQTKQHQSLSTKDLSLLRVIAEISLYSGRKTPLIVKSDDLQAWRQSYNEVDDNQHNQEHQLRLRGKEEY